MTRTTRQNPPAWAIAAARPARLICARAALCFLALWLTAGSAPRAQTALYVTPPIVKRPPTALDRVAPYRRFLWITRWDYHAPEDIRRICYNAASGRFTDILFQVRGEGTVFFPSQVEPWCWELSGSDPSGVGRDPGWDPLDTVIKEARRWGLRVHAYMNVMPGWAQKSPPPRASGQLWVAHRDWFMVDRRGRTMNPASWYAFLDPGLPEVRRHLAEVFGEVARRYPVDGIHLDYVRYPTGDGGEEAGDWAYSPRVLADFRKHYGVMPSRDNPQWRQYRRDQVTAAVRAISQSVRAARPGIEISAAVLADPERARNLAGQSPRQWLEEGLLDAILPMAYTGNMDRFAEYCRYYGEPGLKPRVWMGVWAEAEHNDYPCAQTRKAAALGFPGVGLFAYENLFPEHRSAKRARQLYEVFAAPAQAQR
jgi:uncharacterized lipoprotein YddW (UPF0748 family)